MSQATLAPEPETDAAPGVRMSGPVEVEGERSAEAATALGDEQRQRGRTAGGLVVLDQRV
jgi:hypothetical protein